MLSDCLRTNILPGCLLKSCSRKPLHLALLLLNCPLLTHASTLTCLLSNQKHWCLDLKSFHSSKIENGTALRSHADLALAHTTLDPFTSQSLLSTCSQLSLSFTDKRDGFLYQSHRKIPIPPPSTSNCSCTLSIGWSILWPSSNFTCTSNALIPLFSTI